MTLGIGKWFLFWGSMMACWGSFMQQGFKSSWGCIYAHSLQCHFHLEMRSINHLHYHRLWLNKRLISFRKCIPIGRINVFHKFTWINGLRKPTGNESQTMVKFSDSKWLYDIVNICINWNSLLSTSNLYQHTTLQGYQELFPLNQRLGNMYVYIYICIFFA